MLQGWGLLESNAHPFAQGWIHHFYPIFHDETVKFTQSQCLRTKEELTNKLKKINSSKLNQSLPKKAYQNHNGEIQGPHYTGCNWFSSNVPPLVIE